MKLFNGKKRPQIGNKSQQMYHYDPYDYCNTSAKPQISKHRNLWESMFTKYPDIGKENFVKRFKSSEYQEQLGATFELFLYSFFLKQSYDIDVIDVPSQNTKEKEKTPDFKVTQPDGKSYYLEACCVFPDNDLHNPDQIKKSIIDSINQKIRFNKLRIHIVFSGTCSRQPSIIEITNWVSKLVSIWEGQFSGDNIYNITPVSREFDTFTVTIEPIIESKLDFNMQNNIVFSNSDGEAKLDRSHVSIRKKLRYKANRYKEFRPLVIALNIFNKGSIDEESILNALYGDSKFRKYHDRGKILKEEEFRRKDGFWIRNGKPCYKSVPAIILFDGITPDFIASNWAHIFYNPFIEKQDYFVHSLYLNRISWDESSRKKTTFTELRIEELFDLL